MSQFHISSCISTGSSLTQTLLGSQQVAKAKPAKPLIPAPNFEEESQGAPSNQVKRADTSHTDLPVNNSCFANTTNAKTCSSAHMQTLLCGCTEISERSFPLEYDRECTNPVLSTPLASAIRWSSSTFALGLRML